MEILEQKNIITEINFLDGLNDKEVKNSISELEDKTRDITQSKQNRENRLGRGAGSRISGT